MRFWFLRKDNYFKSIQLQGMNRFNNLLFLVIAGTFFACQGSDPYRFKETYPDAVYDSTFVFPVAGRQLEDPFHWLEKETQKRSRNWLAAQQELSNTFIKNLPIWDSLAVRVEDALMVERISPPIEVRDFYLAWHNSGRDQQDRLVRFSSIGDSKTVLFDPALPGGGQKCQTGIYPAPDQRFVALTTSNEGTDWQTIFIVDLNSGNILKETLNWVQTKRISWWDDGFFYCRRPEPSSKEKNAPPFHQVYFHRLGTHQDEDQRIFFDPAKPGIRYQVDALAELNLVLISGKLPGGGHQLLARPLNRPESYFEPLIETQAGVFELLGALDGRLIIRTTEGAPNGRLISLDPDRPGRPYWRELVAQSEKVLEDALVLQDGVVVLFQQDLQQLLELFDSRGRSIVQPDLPKYTSVLDWAPLNDQSFSLLLGSFNEPGTLYRMSWGEGRLQKWWEPKRFLRKIPLDVQVVYYRSEDGQEVPMHLIKRSDFRLTEDHPTLLMIPEGEGQTQYPEYLPDGISLVPVILERAGVVAIPHIRGGGTYGERWHSAGQKAGKKKAVEDVLAAAAYLLENRHCRADRLGIWGRGQGGSLAASALVKAPDLFVAGMVEGPLTDWIRYPVFRQGPRWIPEMGLPGEEQSLSDMLSYSPYHQTRAASYPPIWITHSLNNDRVSTVHSWKWTAALQQAQLSEGSPILLSSPAHSGNGQYLSRVEQVENAANTLSFYFFAIREPRLHQ